MPQRLTYRSRARRTTSDSVSPLPCALSKAACHRSSGMRMARGVSGIDCPPIGALVLTHGASRIAAHDDAVAPDKGLVARVQHGRPLALRLGAHRHTCGCIADVVGAADGDYCVLHGFSLQVDATAKRNGALVAAGVGDAGGVRTDALNGDDLAKGAVNHSDLDAPDADCVHRASRVGVCIYRVGHAVSTGQGHSQSFFGGVA